MPARRGRRFHRCSRCRALGTNVVGSPLRKGGQDQKNKDECPFPAPVRWPTRCQTGWVSLPPAPPVPAPFPCQARVGVPLPPSPLPTGCFANALPTGVGVPSSCPTWCAKRVPNGVGVPCSCPTCTCPPFPAKQGWVSLPSLPGWVSLTSLPGWVSLYLMPLPSACPMPLPDARNQLLRQMN